MLAQDVGLHGMPQLPDLLDGLNLPIVIHWDATGFGRNQFNTIAIRNPYHPKSAQLLRPIGLGNCDDGRDGTVRLLGPNLDRLNSLIVADQQDVCVECAAGPIKPELGICRDGRLRSSPLRTLGQLGLVLVLEGLCAPRHNYLQQETQHSRGDDAPARHMPLAHM